MKSKNSISIELLNSLSEKEVEHLRELASCRIFNSDKYVVPLIDVLKKRVWRRKKLSTNIQILIYENVFSESVEDSQLSTKQRNLLFSKLSLIIRLIEQLLVQKNMRSNDKYKFEYLYPELLKRKQFKLFEKHIRKDKQTISKITHKTFKDYDWCLQHERSLFDYHYLKEDLCSENLSKLVYYSDIQYQLVMLKHQLTKISLKNTDPNVRFDLPSAEFMENLLNIPKYVIDPIIKIHRTAIRLWESETTDDLENLLELLKKHKDHLDRNELAGFYGICTSACTIAIIHGQHKYSKQMLEIFQTMHKENLIVKNDNIILPTRFKNMISVACRTNSFDWALEMNEYYKPYVLKELRESIYNFNLGYIAFNQKKIELAHNYFLTVGKVDSSYTNSTRLLILQCLFEKNENNYDHFMTALNSAESYLKKYSPLINSVKVSYINFIQALRMLHKIRNNVGNITMADLREKLAHKELYAKKKWLHEKIAELEISKGAKQCN